MFSYKKTSTHKYHRVCRKTQPIKKLKTWLVIGPKKSLENLYVFLKTQTKQNLVGLVSGQVWFSAKPHNLKPWWWYLESY